MALSDDKGDGKAHERPRPHKCGCDLKRSHTHARPVGGDTTLCQTLQKNSRCRRSDGLLLERQFNNTARAAPPSTTSHVQRQMMP